MIPRCSARLQKEIDQLRTCPGPGISASPVDSDITKLLAEISGPEDSPYAGGLFRIQLSVPANYPFEPPRAQFLTPIYHPNIDSDGRICLDTLKPQPQGTWSPSVNLNTLLLSIRLLLAHPNAADGLVAEITEEFRRSYSTYRAKAAEHTRTHAMARELAMDTTAAGLVDSAQGSATSISVLRNTGGAFAAMATEQSTTFMEPGRAVTNSPVSYGGDGFRLVGSHPSRVAYMQEMLQHVVQDEGMMDCTDTADSGNTGIAHSAEERFRQGGPAAKRKRF